MDAFSSSGEFSSVKTQPDQQPAAASELLRFHYWITDELLAETQRVWSRAYGRKVTADEAVDILANVRRLAEVLLHAGDKEIAA